MLNLEGLEKLYSVVENEPFDMGKLRRDNDDKACCLGCASNIILGKNLKIENAFAELTGVSRSTASNICYWFHNSRDKYTWSDVGLDHSDGEYSLKQITKQRALALLDLMIQDAKDGK